MSLMLSLAWIGYLSTMLKIDCAVKLVRIPLIGGGYATSYGD
jgi:hypothetical protein